MAERKPFPIPVKPAVAEPSADELEASACASGEPYALMVLGDSMLPEFEEGEIIVIEPEGLAKDGSFVIANANDELIFRQLVKCDDGWLLKPLNATYPNIPIADLSGVKGVIVMKKKPGRRRAMKEYI
jgi:SOS-response transcriptional repressor LexA